MVRALYRLRQAPRPEIRSLRLENCILYNEFDRLVWGLESSILEKY